MPGYFFKELIYHWTRYTTKDN